LDTAVNLYRFYRDHPDYIWLYRYSDSCIESKAIKASKRCNDVYLWRLKQRINPIIDSFEDDVVFADSDNRHKVYTTPFLFVNLTFDCSPFETYEKAQGIKSFLDLLRKAFGKVYIVAWGLDIQRSGKLHYDAVLFIPAGVKVRWWYSKSRKKHMLVLVNQDTFETIKSKWKEGFANVEGVSSLKEVLRYVLKYCLKSAQNDLLTTIALLYRKRSFYIAPKRIFDLIFSSLSLPLRLDSPMNNCDHSTWIFYGIFPIWRITSLDRDHDPPWVLEVEPPPEVI